MSVQLVATNKEIDLNHLVTALRESGYEVVSNGFKTLTVKPSGYCQPKKESTTCRAQH